MAAGLARLWARCQHDPTPSMAWVAMADVDAFKPVNDTYGHTAGDEVLAAVAVALANAVRGDDLVARYGGDEFLLAGRAGGRREVERIAARLVEAVRSLELTPVGSDRPVRVTASVGAILAAPAADCGARDAIAAADRALYRAKVAGRDRAEVEPGILGG